MSGSGSGGNSLDQLEQQLERSIENVRQIRIIVSDFQPQGQPALNAVRQRKFLTLFQFPKKLRSLDSRNSSKS